MRIAITGSSGLIGRGVCALLANEGHRIRAMVRHSPTREDEIHWDPATETIDSARLSGIEAFVHLAGASVAGGRWTEARKKEIRDSRIAGTRLLCEAIAEMTKRPRVLIAASAIGFYGNRGQETLTEDSPPGKGFLPDLTRAWEAATLPARDSGIRVVNLRIGVVLSSRGGALARLLLPFRLGLGGVLGDGRQMMSWIALEDVVRAIDHAIATEALAGPVNAVAPTAVDNRTFTKILGLVLGRPTLLPVPASLVRLAFGEMGDELLLSSTNVRPSRLLSSGFSFLHPDLESALRAALAGD
jgi:uncharacterized protein (TIGR01777 family)